MKEMLFVVLSLSNAFFQPLYSAVRKVSYVNETKEEKIFNLAQHKKMLINGKRKLSELSRDSIEHIDLLLSSSLNDSLISDQHAQQFIVQILGRNPDLLNQCTSVTGVAPLQCAGQQKNEKIAQFILDNYSEANVTDYYTGLLIGELGKTPVESINIDEARRLIDQGARIKSNEVITGRTPLVLAIQGHYDDGVERYVFIQELIVEGASTAPSDLKGFSARLLRKSDPLYWMLRGERFTRDRLQSLLNPWGQLSSGPLVGNTW